MYYTSPRLLQGVPQTVTTSQTVGLLMEHNTGCTCEQHQHTITQGKRMKGKLLPEKPTEQQTTPASVRPESTNRCYTTISGYTGKKLTGAAGRVVFKGKVVYWCALDTLLDLLIPDSKEGNGTFLSFWVKDLGSGEEKIAQIEKSVQHYHGHLLTKKRRETYQRVVAVAELNYTIHIFIVLGVEKHETSKPSCSNLKEQNLRKQGVADGARKVAGRVQNPDLGHERLVTAIAGQRTREHGVAVNVLSFAPLC
ncbi:hypothetical protein J6590_034583 [Homalodisca vitripennis]|nr:hypothetical protein J6590_034583 [Homalodisca vitripennis]